MERPTHTKVVGCAVELTIEQSKRMLESQSHAALGYYLQIRNAAVVARKTPPVGCDPGVVSNHLKIILLLVKI